MKKLIYISLLVFIPLILFAQENQSSSVQKDKNENFHLKSAAEKQTFIKDSSACQQLSVSDSSNDNINKRGMRRQQMKKRIMDKFMDKDGDGINDCRGKGMGLSGKGKHKGFGRHGK